MEKSEIINKIIELSKTYFEKDNLESSFVPFISKIPVSGKVLDANDLENLIRSSLDMWLTAVDYTNAFERKVICT